MSNCKFIGHITNNDYKLRGIKDKHKKWLIDKGLPYNGVKEDSLKKPRVTHCYSCKQHLDNSIDIECITCDWIICSCGACGCGYENY